MAGHRPPAGEPDRGSEDLELRMPPGVKLLRTLEGHTSWVNSVAFDPTGRILASGSLDKTIKLWEPTSGKLLRTLEGHADDVENLAFSPEGRLLASKSRDHTVRLWSTGTWQTVAVIPEPTHPGPNLRIRALAFDGTSGLLATAGSAPDNAEAWPRGRLIHIWELDLDALLHQGRRAR